MKAEDLRKVAAKLPLGPGCMAENREMTAEAHNAQFVGHHKFTPSRETEQPRTVRGKSAKLPASPSYNPQTVTAFFATYLIPKPEFEWTFSTERKFRFDLAWPDRRVALEVQGGIWTGGAHVRGAALMREWEKLNIAAGLGWRVLFCSPSILMTESTARAVKLAIFWQP